MDLWVRGDGSAGFGDRILRSAIGRGGLTLNKREGDGATPIGSFACRVLYWRPDRVMQPSTSLPARALLPTDGWCDDPADPAYNQAVRLPYPGRHEALWREDGVYDLIVPLGYNDAPIVAAKGSAIFLHIARPDRAPTEGCVALALNDLLAFLAVADTASRVIVRP